MRVSKKMISNVAQIIICVILFPFFSVLLKFVFPDKQIIEVGLDLIKSLPIMSVWFELLTDFSNFEQLLFNLEAMDEKYGYYILYSFYDIYVIAVLVEITNSVSSKLGWKGLRIIPNICAVLLACILEKITGDDLTEIYFEGIVLFIIYIAIMLFVSKSTLIKSIIAFSINLYISFYIALFSTMYIAVLGLIHMGRIIGVENICISIGVTFFGLLISCVISYLVSPSKNK